MKKAIKILLSAVLALTLSIGFMGCSEMGGPSTSATAIGYGHGNTNKTVIEVTVIVGSDGMPKSIYFDEIFDIDSISKRTSANTAETGVTTTTIGSTNYANYLFIDGEQFNINVDGTKVTYKSATGDRVNDLGKYCGEDDTGREWYYNAVINKKCFYGTVAAGGAVSPSGTAFTNQSNGSIRKRQSNYWQTGITSFSGLGWRGNMDMLERYILTYGFDDIVFGEDGNIKNPSASNLYVEIGDVTTGATLGADTHLYLKVAKAAYDKARA